MSELVEDVINRDSDKRFRLRIDSSLRSIGVSQIVGTKEYLEIEFIGEEFSITVGYPQNLEELCEVVKKKLLETQLDIEDINSISYYIKEYTDEIESFLKQI